MLVIGTEKLADLTVEARKREASHVMRTYTLELARFGILLRVVDRSTNHAYCTDRLIQYDALAFAGMDYALKVFNRCDEMVAAGLDSLSEHGSREAVA